MKQTSINFNSHTRIMDAAGFQLSWVTATAEMAGAEPAMRQAQAESFLDALAAGAAPWRESPLLRCRMLPRERGPATLR